MLTIYCPYHSPRLAYIAHWLGVQLTGQPAALVQHLKDAPAGQPLLAYCPQPPAVPALHIYPTGLLQQAGISPPTITWHQSPAGPAFFETPGQGTTLGFDVLAASFYLLSRYEEYLPHTKDSFGRYCHTQSTLWQQGLLHTPVVDGWVQFVKGTLQKLFPQWQPLEGQPQWQLTYDVDMVTAYKGKGLWRNTGGALMELVKGRWARLHQRMQVLRGNHPDPLLPYDHLLQWHERLGAHPFYFVLATTHFNRYDKATPVTHPVVQRTICQWASHSHIGLHASYKAHAQYAQVMQEKQNLLRATLLPITQNRMHYLMLHLPATCRLLLQAGITTDWSMGYGYINGFRAGTSLPFTWYDLEKECITPLTLVPFAWMDANSLFELKQSPQEAMEELAQLWTQVKGVNGQLVTIVHPHMMGNPAWHPWWEGYQKLVEGQAAYLA